MKNKRLWEYKDDFLVFLQIVHPKMWRATFNTDCRVNLPNFILIPLYPIIADKGLEYIYKHQNLATMNQWLANQPLLQVL